MLPGAMPLPCAVSDSPMLPPAAGSDPLRTPTLGSLRVGTPPYRSFQQRFQLSERRPPGTVLVLEPNLPAFVDRPTPTIRAIHQLRIRALDSRMSGAAGPLEATVLRQIVASGMRAFVREEFSEQSVRRALAESDLVRRDVQIWLTARLASSAPRSVVPALGAVVCGQSVPSPTLRATRTALGGDIPTLHKWKMVGKVLGPLVRLQTEPAMTVETAARESPYSAASGLRAACRSLFNVPPSEIRRCLGWEWLLDRFLERKGG